MVDWMKAMTAALPFCTMKLSLKLSSTFLEVCTQVCLHGQAGSLPQHEWAYYCGPASESAA